MKNVKYFPVLLLVSAVPTSAFGMFARHIARAAATSARGVRYVSSRMLKRLEEDMTIKCPTEKDLSYEELIDTGLDLLEVRRRLDFFNEVVGHELQKRAHLQTKLGTDVRGKLYEYHGK